MHGLGCFSLAKCGGVFFGFDLFVFIIIYFLSGSTFKKARYLFTVFSYLL